jgi:hypothetical protein
MEQLQITTWTIILIFVWLFYRQLRNSGGGITITAGENGVWVIRKTYSRRDITRPEIKFIHQAKTRAESVRNLIRKKTNLQVKVQPVVVLNNAKADLKFRFFQTEGVYVVQKNWLEKLMAEYPPEHLNRDKAEEIKRVVFKSAG